MSKLADLNISELEVFLIDEGIAGHIVSCLEGNTVVKKFRYVGIGVRV